MPGHDQWCSFMLPLHSGIACSCLCLSPFANAYQLGALLYLFLFFRVSIFFPSPLSSLSSTPAIHNKPLSYSFSYSPSFPFFSPPFFLISLCIVTIPITFFKVYSASSTFTPLTHLHRITALYAPTRRIITLSHSGSTQQRE